MTSEPSKERDKDCLGAVHWQCKHELSTLERGDFAVCVHNDIFAQVLKVILVVDVVD